MNDWARLDRWQVDEFSLGETSQVPVSQGRYTPFVPISCGQEHQRVKKKQPPNRRATGDEIGTSAPTSQSGSAAVAYTESGVNTD